MDNEELIKFWKSPANGSGNRNFLEDSPTLRDRAFFHNLAWVSGGSDLIFVKILSQSLGRKSLLNFESNPDPSPYPDTDSDPHHILLVGRIRSLAAPVVGPQTYRCGVFEYS